MLNFDKLSGNLQIPWEIIDSVENTKFGIFDCTFVDFWRA